jgi:hypothetical protein
MCWTICSKHANHYRLNNQHNWEDLYDHLVSIRIFTLTMNKIFIWAPKIDVGKHGQWKQVDLAKKTAWHLCSHLRDGVEEITRNTSCFVIWFVVNKLLHLRQVKSNPLLVQKRLPHLSIQVFLYACKNANKSNWLNGNPKVTSSDVKYDISNQSLHQAFHCILFGPQLLQVTISGVNKNHSTPNPMHTW